jgi:hypothetical protein
MTLGRVLTRVLREAFLLAVAMGFALVAAAQAQPACDGQAVPAGGQSIDVAGASRAFTVRPASEGDPGVAAPVVFALHPFGMNAQYMQSRAPVGRLWPSAIVVYPEGMARDTTNRVPSWQGRRGELGDRDLAFFDAMLAWLGEHGCIDQAVVASKAWAAANTCAAPPKPGVRGCVQAQSCTGAPVTLCTHGGGHEYDTSFTRTAVDFFQSVNARH